MTVWVRHTLRVEPTGQQAAPSGRECYSVICEDCDVLVHEGTTAPGTRVKEHLEGRSPYEQPLVRCDHCGLPNAAPESDVCPVCWDLMLRGYGWKRAGVLHCHRESTDRDAAALKELHRRRLFRSR